MYPKCRQYPKGITVGNAHWDVKFCRKTPDHPPTDVGLCDPETRTIYIRYKQSRRETLMTFLHEWLHAVEFEYEIEIGHTIIEKLEDAVIEFCEENPEVLVNFLFQMLGD